MHPEYVDEADGGRMVIRLISRPRIFGLAFLMFNLCIFMSMHNLSLIELVTFRRSGVCGETYNFYTLPMLDHPNPEDEYSPKEHNKAEEQRKHDHRASN